jgi:hypothetical protein
MPVPLRQTDAWVVAGLGGFRTMASELFDACWMWLEQAAEHRRNTIRNWDIPGWGYP